MPLAFGIGKSRGAAFDPAIEACNYIQFYWNWTDGKDFDVRAEFLRPTALAGQVVGTNRLPQIVDGGGSITYMKWGGDNADDTEGYEGIYIDVDAVKTLPGGIPENIIELDMRGTWYAEIGAQPVVISATGYNGGTMTLERDTPNVPGRGFINTGYATSFTDFKVAPGVVVTSAGHSEANGQRLTKVVIDLNRFTLAYSQN
tara:strand:+ start:614 stop:1216 length:603 start_codon:yes stop_codon:yes gene_type:complete